jgi:hypothetical protein
MPFVGNSFGGRLDVDRPPCFYLDMLRTGFRKILMWDQLVEYEPMNRIKWV